jgi:hypothetical protein
MEDENMSDTNYRCENERYLLNIIKSQLGITEEYMKNPGIIKAKFRESSINKVLA